MIQGLFLLLECEQVLKPLKRFSATGRNLNPRMNPWASRNPEGAGFVSDGRSPSTEKSNYHKPRSGAIFYRRPKNAPLHLSQWSLQIIKFVQFKNWLTCFY